MAHPYISMAHGAVACARRTLVSCLSRVSGFSGPGLYGLHLRYLPDPSWCIQSSLLEMVYSQIKNILVLCIWEEADL